MQDAWRAYLELAMGLTEAPRKRAQNAVRRLVGTGGATAAQVQTLAEELVSTGAANREALTKLVRFEVDRALGAVGLATADEVAELTRRVHELERQLREAKGGPGALLPGAPVGPAPTSGAAAPVSDDAVAGAPAVAPGAVPPAGPDAVVAPESGPGASGAPAPAAGTSVSTGGTATPAPPPGKAVAKKAVAKKAVAKKAVAKKAVARKPPAAVSTDAGPTPAVRPAKKVVARKRATGGNE